MIRVELYISLKIGKKCGLFGSGMEPLFGPSLKGENAMSIDKKIAYMPYVPDFPGQSRI